MCTAQTAARQPDSQKCIPLSETTKGIPLQLSQSRKDAKLATGTGSWLSLPHLALRNVKRLRIETDKEFSVHGEIVSWKLSPETQIAELMCRCSLRPCNVGLPVSSCLGVCVCQPSAWRLCSLAEVGQPAHHRIVRRGRNWHRLALALLAAFPRPRTQPAHNAQMQAHTNMVSCLPMMRSRRLGCNGATSAPGRFSKAHGSVVSQNDDAFRNSDQIQHMQMWSSSYELLEGEDHERGAR